MGFNCAEAVNFAMKQWLQVGQAEAAGAALLTGCSQSCQLAWWMVLWLLASLQLCAGHGAAPQALHGLCRWCWHDCTQEQASPPSGLNLAIYYMVHSMRLLTPLALCLSAGGPLLWQLPLRRAQGLRAHRHAHLRARVGQRV
jgi:hypothetical protein